MIKIAPSILAANFAELGAEIHKVEAAGADMLHIDVMDGHFVPNLTIGPPVVSSLRHISKLFFDVHLMVNNPQDLIIPFIKAGTDSLTFHVETAPHLHRLIQFTKSEGIAAGVSLNPATPISTVEEVLDEVDLVLIMSVNPGFGGQQFIPSTLNKIIRLKEIIDKRCLKTSIQVDGGINTVTARQVISAGADILVAGTAIYGAGDIGQAIKDLRG